MNELHIEFSQQKWGIGIGIPILEIANIAQLGPTKQGF